jgi:hypothetical protein
MPARDGVSIIRVDVLCHCSRLEGQLSKWTNALKGWQQRWLSVDQQQGVLHYYTVSRERERDGEVNCSQVQFTKFC